MGPRIFPSPRIGTSPSIITARRPRRPCGPCRLVGPPGWPHHTTTTRISVPRLIHSTRRNRRKRSSDHTAPAALSRHMVAGPTLGTHLSTPILTLRQPLLACHSSRCTTSLIYTTTPRHSNRSSKNNTSSIRHRVCQNTMACLLYLAAHSSLRGQC